MLKIKVMSVLVSGGNPVEDRKKAMKRFSTIVHPILSNQGFGLINKTSQIMYNEKQNIIIISTSAPSQTKMVNDLKVRVRKLKKFHNTSDIYLLFTRDYNQWRDKPIYQSTLKRIMKISHIKGICVGLDKLELFVDSCMKKEPFYLIY